MDSTSSPSKQGFPCPYGYFAQQEGASSCSGRSICMLLEPLRARMFAGECHGRHLRAGFRWLLAARPQSLDELARVVFFSAFSSPFSISASYIGCWLGYWPHVLSCPRSHAAGPSLDLISDTSSEAPCKPRGLTKMSSRGLAKGQEGAQDCAIAKGFSFEAV